MLTLKEHRSDGEIIWTRGGIRLQRVRYSAGGHRPVWNGPYLRGTRAWLPDKAQARTIRGVLLDEAILLVFASVGNTLLDALGIGFPAFWSGRCSALLSSARPDLRQSLRSAFQNGARAGGRVLPARRLRLPARRTSPRGTRRDHEHPPIHRRRWYCRAGATLPRPHSSSPP